MANKVVCIKLTDLIIFGMSNPGKIWHVHLKDFWSLCTAPISCSHFTLEIQKGQYQQHFSCILLIIYVISEENKFNPFVHPTSKCHHTNLLNAKRFHLPEGWLRSFKCWWLWKEPVVMCDNWNVRQAMSPQVFKVTTFCMVACSQSFPTLISRTVHHAVLKFSPMSQQAAAATRPYRGLVLDTRAPPVACPSRGNRAADNNNNNNKY